MEQSRWCSYVLLRIAGRPTPWGPGTGRGGASRCGPRVPVTVKAPRLPGGEVRAPFPPLTEPSWRGLVAYSLFDWALPQRLKRGLVVLDPSLCLPAPLPDPSFPEPSFRRGDCVFEV